MTPVTLTKARTGVKAAEFLELPNVIIVARFADLGTFVDGISRVDGRASNEVRLRTDGRGLSMKRIRRRDD